VRYDPPRWATGIRIAIGRRIEMPKFKKGQKLVVMDPTGMPIPLSQRGPVSVVQVNAKGGVKVKGSKTFWRASRFAGASRFAAEHYETPERTTEPLPTAVQKLRTRLLRSHEKAADNLSEAVNQFITASFELVDLLE
jgi:hypothetical protein